MHNQYLFIHSLILFCAFTRRNWFWLFHLHLYFGNLGLNLNLDLFFDFINAGDELIDGLIITIVNDGLLRHRANSCIGQERTSSLPQKGFNLNFSSDHILLIKILSYCLNYKSGNYKINTLLQSLKILFYLLLLLKIAYYLFKYLFLTAVLFDYIFYWNCQCNLYYCYFVFW